MKNRRNRIDIKIGGVDYSKYLALPFVFQDTGTEQLDSAIVTLRNLPTDGKFAPFTAVSLCGGKYTYVIADDRIQAVFGRSLWNHEITLIGETKATERILMEGKSFTQPLARNLAQNQPAWCYWYNTKHEYEAKKFGENGYTTPIVIDSAMNISVVAPNVLNGMFFPNPDALYATYDIEVAYSTTALSMPNQGDDARGDTEGVVIFSASRIDGGASVVFNADKTGIYTVKYFVYGEDNSGVNPDWAYFVPVSIYLKDEMPQKYSIYDVMTITLETAEPLFKGDAPRYGLTLTDEQKARYKAMDAPEMYFPNGRSLYENLKEIGDYIHALPRVKNGDVYWQELGSAERADLSKGKLYGENADYNAADYASTVEANFANLINAADEAEGSVTEPFTNGSITLRSNSYRIKEEDSFIPTTFPIGTKISKALVFVHKSNGEVKEVDITSAIFEKNEYDLLSSFTGIYPFSKTHALFYTTGQKNIDGLWYRAEDSALSFMNQFKQYAIANVIEFFGNIAPSEYNNDYTRLAFRITYIPIINGRAHQERTEDTEHHIVLAHNQSANQLSAKAFGENLRGKVSMLANATESKLYLFPSLEDIPKGGQMYDRKKFIGLVTTKVFPDYCLSQIDLSENYNNAGAFVQMKTGIRQYEIPQGQERCTLLEEYCIIGKQMEHEANTLCRVKMRDQTMSAFGVPTPEDITSALIVTRDEDEKIIQENICLPVYSTSLGTSVYFGFRFADNYSAGARSVDLADKARGTEYVEYGTPFYARAKYLDFALVPSYADGGLNGANRLPIINEEPTKQYITTPSYLVWNKDGADIGNVAYQLHFVSNDGYIIGSELARMMPYVRSSIEYKNAPIVYFYDTEIDELTGEAHGTPVKTSTLSIVSQPQYRYLVIDNIPTEAYKSFVIKRPDGAFILGKNTDKADQYIHFNFKRKR